MSSALKRTNIKGHWPPRWQASIFNLFPIDTVGFYLKTNIVEPWPRKSNPDLLLIYYCSTNRRQPMCLTKLESRDFNGRLDCRLSVGFLKWFVLQSTPSFKSDLYYNKYNPNWNCVKYLLLLNWNSKKRKIFQSLIFTHESHRCFCRRNLINLVPKAQRCLDSRCVINVFTLHNSRSLLCHCHRPVKRNTTHAFYLNLFCILYIHIHIILLYLTITSGFLYRYWFLLRYSIGYFKLLVLKIVQSKQSVLLRSDNKENFKKHHKHYVTNKTIIDLVLVYFFKLITVLFVTFLFA